MEIKNEIIRLLMKRPHFILTFYEYHFNNTLKKKHPA